MPSPRGGARRSQSVPRVMRGDDAHADRRMIGARAKPYDRGEAPLEMRRRIGGALCQCRQIERPARLFLDRAHQRGHGGQPHIGDRVQRVAAPARAKAHRHRLRRERPKAHVAPERRARGAGGAAEDARRQHPRDEGPLGGSVARLEACPAFVLVQHGTRIVARRPQVIPRHAFNIVPPLPCARRLGYPWCHKTWDGEAR